MSQSDSLQEDWSIASPLCLHPEAAEGGVGLTLAPAEYQALLEELAEAQDLDQQRLTRIAQLEQALDQALVCLDDLKAQIRDQNVLETQLAATEDFSHVQQQAIARLKLQLTECQQALESQILETQQRDQAVQELMATIETLTQAQQQEIERLRLRLTQDQREAQSQRNRSEKQIQDLQTTLEIRQQRISELEAETLAARSLTASFQGQLEIAQQQVKELSTTLRHHQASWAQLEAQLEQTQVASKVRQNLAQNLAASPTRSQTPPEPGATLAAVHQDLIRTQRQVKNLEQQLMQQMMSQTQWQQSHYQLEEERDRLQARITTLEQQSSEMQEQILHQAQQASEYETAVQYWKDHCTMSQRQMAQLKEWVEQSLTHQSTGGEIMLNTLADFLATLQPATPVEPSDAAPSPLPLSRLKPLELPDFLVRRRSNKSKEQGSGTRS
ncbi:MAG: hypothetical protein HC769_00110 [Cyanobacteria bacterium CRU_2_1]|nr:hypothetical protein [Cyanobacteria bacterium RU_5_0]NJR57385.1 hypothetical protein [Cyanobacteria bacterium CRU_2_1]